MVVVLFGCNIMWSCQWLPVCQKKMLSLYTGLNGHFGRTVYLHLQGSATDKTTQYHSSRRTMGIIRHTEYVPILHAVLNIHAWQELSDNTRSRYSISFDYVLLVFNLTLMYDFIMLCDFRSY